MKQIDCRGLSCPVPVVNTKRALKESPGGIEVLLDAKVAVENVCRFAGATGYRFEVKEEAGEWTVTITK